MRGGRILVIDDDPDIVRILRDRLLREGYEVATAMDGREGLERAIAEPPDLIILDVMLPRMDGLDVCRTLKGLPGLDSIPVVMLTASAQLGDKVSGLDAGAEDYVTKPFHALELCARIRALLRTRDRQRDAVRQGLVDPDTGVATRSFLEAYLAKELSRARRNGQPVSLLLLAVGPPTLRRSAAELLRGLVRKSDLLAHAGEGTFAVLLMETAREGAEIAGARLVRALAEIAEKPGPPSLRVGIAGREVVDEGGAAAAAALIRQAEQALAPAAPAAGAGESRRGRAGSRRAGSRR